jgi:RNA polymerase sigma factor (sigma-70 family)
MPAVGEGRRPGVPGASAAATIFRMRDLEIVALLTVGDSAGLEAAYTTYADRIHDYARYMLRGSSPEAAADVTQDTFLIALAKAGSLRDPGRFKPWLYAIARNECLRVIRTARRTTSLDPDDADNLAAEGSPDMSTGLAGDDLRALVHAAAEGLSPKDREVFELGLRHDLSGPDVARALGVSDNAAHAMLSRVRSQFERALGALMVAREGRGSCPTLDEMLQGWDGSFQPLWRKRIARHISECKDCARLEKRELSPAALLALTPFLAAPAVVRSRVLEDRTELVAYSKMLVERAGPFDADGFPGLPPPARRKRGAVAVVAALLLLFGGFAVIRTLTDSPQRGVPESAIGTPSLTSTLPSSLPAVGPTETLRPKQSIVVEPIEDTSLTPTETVSTTPTTTAPSAPTTTAPTTTAPVPLGTLQARPESFTAGPAGPGTVVLRAVGGPVAWTATTSGPITLSDDSGSLSSGDSTTVTVSASVSVNVVVSVSGHEVTFTATVT